MAQSRSFFPPSRIAAWLFSGHGCVSARLIFFLGFLRKPLQPGKLYLEVFEPDRGQQASQQDMRTLNCRKV